MIRNKCIAVVLVAVLAVLGVRSQLVVELNSEDGSPCGVCPLSGFSTLELKNHLIKSYGQYDADNEGMIRNNDNERENDGEDKEDLDSDDVAETGARTFLDSGSHGGKGGSGSVGNKKKNNHHQDFDGPKNKDHKRKNLGPKTKGKGEGKKDKEDHEWNDGGCGERCRNRKHKKHSKHGHKDSGHKDSGHKDFGHKKGGHKDSGNKVSGHKGSGHKDSGHKDFGHKKHIKHHPLGSDHKGLHRGKHHPVEHHHNSNIHSSLHLKNNQHRHIQRHRPRPVHGFPRKHHHDSELDASIEGTDSTVDSEDGEPCHGSDCPDYEHNDSNGHCYFIRGRRICTNQRHCFWYNGRLICTHHDSNDIAPLKPNCYKEGTETVCHPIPIDSEEASKDDSEENDEETDEDQERR